MSRKLDFETQQTLDYLMHNLDIYGNTVLNRKVDVKRYIKLLLRRGYVVNYRKTQKYREPTSSCEAAIYTDWCYILELKEKLTGKEKAGV